MAFPLVPVVVGSLVPALVRTLMVVVIIRILSIQETREVMNTRTLQVLIPPTTPTSLPQVLLLNIHTLVVVLHRLVGTHILYLHKQLDRVKLFKYFQCTTL
jgi:hypothetical protein